MTGDTPSSPSLSRLDELTRALERSAARLRDDALDADAAAREAENCARLASEAAAELDRAVRTASGDGVQGELL